MRFIKIRDSDSKEFKEAWKIYEYSFPPDERRKFALQNKLLKNEKYNFFIIIKNKILVGIIVYWKLDDFLFVEHLAVKKELKGKGIGTELITRFLSNNRQKIVLEVEKPKTDTATKRIRFYEKLGFKLNDFDYIQPPYGKGKNPVPLYLMTYPLKISKPEFSKVRKKLHMAVYCLKRPLLKYD